MEIKTCESCAWLNEDTRGMKFNIKEGHAVAFDFDGVIHRYSKG